MNSFMDRAEIGHREIKKIKEEVIGQAKLELPYGKRAYSGL